MNADEEILEHTIRGLSVLRSGNNVERAMAAGKLEQELSDRLRALRGPASPASPVPPAARPPLHAPRRVPRPLKCPTT
jgi:hypothetical protein